MSDTTDFIGRVIANYGPHVTDRAFTQQWEVMQGCADNVIELLGAVPPARILDLACGTGSSTAAMALRGFDVTGIDCTPASIEIARRGAEAKGAKVQWLCQDMRTIRYAGEFDFVCLRDVIFGIFEGDGEDLDMIRRIATALKPGGKCLIEAYNKEFSLVPGVEGFLFYDKALDRFVDPTPGHKGLSIRLYSHEQWRQMFETCGLRLLRTTGWKRPQDPPPPPLRADCFVAQKIHTA